MRGPKPKPDAVKAQRADVRSTRKARPTLIVAAVEASGLQPPTWLKDAGLDLWNSLAPTLASARLLGEADIQAFGRYCRNFARWLKLQTELDTDGETYESDSNHGKLKRANPAFLIADRIERQLLAAEDRFGLNPAERQRIFAARANTGVSGELFPQAKREGDPATPAAQPSKPIEGPIGLLN